MNRTRRAGFGQMMHFSESAVCGDGGCPHGTFRSIPELQSPRWPGVQMLMLIKSQPFLDTWVYCEII